MRSSQTIESKDTSVGGLFDDYYVVPDYQREYVWESAQVDQLLEDIWDEFSDRDGGSVNEYFIGSVVVCEKEGRLFELIDGQQRLTTLFLFLCAVRDHLQELGESPVTSLDLLIKSLEMDRNGDEVARYRVVLQYEDSEDVLQTIGEGRIQELTAKKSTRSITNIVNAYENLRSFFQTYVGTDSRLLRKFYAFFIRNVKLIRISTSSLTHALKIFETINDRGKGLDSMDLMKNQMFRRSRHGEFDQLKRRWKEMVDVLYQANEKPLRFLRYFVLATYNVDRLKEQDIYDWFGRNAELCGFDKEPLRFVEQLLAAAHAYANFIGGRDRYGRANRYLANIQYLSGAARQHLVLLMAARAMDAELFSALCRHVENLFFIHIITRENTREFERNFATWANELRKVNDKLGLFGFVQRRFESSKANLSARFDLAFKDLSTDSIQKYRVRYILAKLTQYVDEAGYGERGAHQDLATYLNKNVELEHILPQNPSVEAAAEFGSGYVAADYVSMLGNLALVEKPINASVGNRAFALKRVAYRDSQFLLTKSIGVSIQIGVNTSIDRAVRGLEPFDRWTGEAVSKRQQKLAALARQVWDVPEGSAVEPEEIRSEEVPVEGRELRSSEVVEQLGEGLWVSAARAPKQDVPPTDVGRESVSRGLTNARAVYDHVRAQHWTTNKDVRELLGFTSKSATSTISSYLRRWSDPSDGFLVRVGERAACRYRLREGATRPEAALSVRQTSGRASFSPSGYGSKKAAAEASVREYVRAHGSVSNKEVRNLLGFGNSNSETTQVSKYLRQWSAPGGFLRRDDSNFPLVRYYPVSGGV